MKKFLFIVLAQLSALVAASQFSIANTRWMVHTEIPFSRDLVLDFRKDTIRVFTADGVETSSALFSQHHDSLYIRKLSGRSPCPDGSHGWYGIEWRENGEKFLLHVIEDSCRSRVYGGIDVIRKIKVSN